MVLTVDSWTFADARIQGVTLHPVVGAYELRFGLMIVVGATTDTEQSRAVSAYSGHRNEAIFLTGIPDIRQSLPHASACQ